MVFFEIRVIDIYLFIAFAIISFVLFSILVLPKNRWKENSYLAGILVLLMCHLLLIALFNNQLMPDLAYGRISYVFNLLYGSFFYTYFQKSFGEKDNSFVQIPIWLIIGICLPMFQVSPTIYKLVIIFAFGGNLILTIRLAMRRWIKNDKSSSWLKFAMCFFAVFSFTYITEISLNLANIGFSASQMRYLYFSELLVLAGGFMFFSHRFPSSFQHVKIVKLDPQNSLQTDPTAATEISILVKSLERGALHKNPDLNRSTFTKMTGISANRVSELINGHFGMNFSTWVNAYRIEEAKLQLVNKAKQRSIKEIYFEVGFNSKSAFNKAFKQHTGYTPTDYREHLK